MKSLWRLSVLLLFSTLCFAAQPDRIAGTIDNTDTVVLAGSVAAQAQPQNDRGPVESSMPLPYIVLQIQPSPRQQSALNRLLAQQQDSSSRNYRQWLTPEQYADRFGLSENDVKKVAAWLRSQGFSIVQTARGRDWIAFSGTAGSVESTFHTEIHHFEVDGEMHFANATALSIPQALTGIVVGFRGLHDFAPKPMGIRSLSGWDKLFMDIVHPFYDAGFGHALAPGDVATIYDISPLYTAGIDGNGQSLVIVGQSDIQITDIEEFRTNFGLSANNPRVILVPGSPDPGTGDELEADLDLEWSGAVARSASIIYVNSNNAFSSAVYAIDQDLAPVISMSFGGCEQQNAAFIPTNEPTMQKASAEGITFLASSGDSGAAACDSDQKSDATLGLAVNYPASSPEVTGVGGNEFNEGSGNYWGNSNGPNGGSALSYIPEMAWNDTTENNMLTASGGGASSCDSSGCASGFPKPSWQVGTGVPSDGVRDVPDVAFAASANHDGYLFCSASNGANCANGIATNEVVGGTSASTPLFAGMVVLLNQKLANNPPGAGNINSNLYLLAQSPSNGIFHDITTGNNMVPCNKGSIDCPNGGTIGYNAGVGYDQVTGLGSVDANNLVTEFTSAPTTTTLTSSLNPAGSGVAVTFTATVTGSNSPSGTVTFNDSSTAICRDVALSSGVASCQTTTLAVGGHSITAAYSGDSKNLKSTSAVLIETITATGGLPTTTVVLTTPNPSTYGAPVTLIATVTTTSGNPPGDTVTFQDSGTPLGFSPVNAINSSSGTATFSTSSLTAGMHSISGLYSGDSNNNATSTSAAVPQIVNKAPTTTAAPALLPASVNVKSSGPVMMTALLTPSSGPTGSINFSVDGVAAGSTMVGGRFSYNPSALAAGSHSVVAAYQGDSNFISSISTATTLNVQDFTISANPSTVTISAAGQSGSTTLTITPVGGFNQTLNYACSGLPALASCTFAPTSATTETVTISTLASARLRTRPFGAGIFYAMLFPGLMGLVLPSNSKKRTWRRMLTLLAVLTVTVLWIPACGGGGGGGSGNTGTPTGSSTVTITASTFEATGNLSHSVMITLNVQ
jgi:subtilase family serine protease